jgi:outer membrane protein TolC
MRTIIIFALTLVGFNAFSQSSVDSVLANIERNNTTLSAYRKSIDAEKIGNKTGLTPQNPEVEFNYLWGNPSAIGNRTDFSIRQSFDLPMLYSYRNQIANIKNEQAELEYLKLRKEILFQARLLCTELLYYNSLAVETSKRLDNAKQLAYAFKTKFDIGETGVLEYNKAQLYYLNISKDFEKVEIERKALQLELIRLNGGIAIVYNETNLFIPSVMPNFEQWYTSAELNNPVLQWVKTEIALREKQTQLTVSQSLPEFYAGYMSEKVVGQQFQGVTIGITIPLWENKNAVKYAKANTLAMQSMQTDAKLQFYNEMKTLHAKVISLQSNVDDYRNKLASFSNTELLQKALDKGEISLAEYFFELSLYYESADMFLDMQHDLLKTYSELQKYY